MTLRHIRSDIVPTFRDEGTFLHDLADIRGTISVLGVSYELSREIL